MGIKYRKLKTETIDINLFMFSDIDAAMEHYKLIRRNDSLVSVARINTDHNPRVRVMTYGIHDESITQVLTDVFMSAHGGFVGTINGELLEQYEGKDVDEKIFEYIADLMFELF